MKSNLRTLASVGILGVCLSVGTMFLTGSASACIYGNSQGQPVSMNNNGRMNNGFNNNVHNTPSFNNNLNNNNGYNNTPRSTTQVSVHNYPVYVAPVAPIHVNQIHVNNQIFSQRGNRR